MKTEYHPIRILTLLLFVIFVQGCTDPTESTNDQTINTSGNPDDPDDPDNTINIETAILIDASHDGGVWWYPQANGFSSAKDHQGKALADYLRSKGFDVDELPRGTTVTSDILIKYNKVIRAGKFGNYSESELKAYDEFLDKKSSLILISEFLRSGERDELAERIGIPFTGLAKGEVKIFADHPITKNVIPFSYITGSVVLDVSSNPMIEVLGCLAEDTPVELSNSKISNQVDPPDGIAVMGILHHPKAKIFFIGDINGIEGMPQPLISNLVHWAFE